MMTRNRMLRMKIKIQRICQNKVWYSYGVKVDEVSSRTVVRLSLNSFPFSRIGRDLKVKLKFQCLNSSLGIVRRKRL